MYRVLFLFFIVTLSFCQEETITALTKQKLELKELKKELNDFYNKKEAEYQKRKKELQILKNEVEKEKKEVQDLYDKRLELLQDIKSAVKGKVAKIYNGMKPKIAASIFDEMINEGKIEDVFDIILKLKEKNVTAIMKYLSLPSSVILTEKLENFKKNEKE